MQLIQTIQKHNMLTPGNRVLAAVSGGADSVALLYGLLELPMAPDLLVCHVNHNLRGEESHRDAEFVRNLCDSLSVPFFLRSVEVPCGASLEEAAREARYAALLDCASECGVNIIATGHNENDNAETLLLRLCRGTGLSGLTGIPPVRKSGGISFIRPLIETTRAEIESFLTVRSISYRTDSSNFDINFSRNRVRQDIIPALEKINPQAVKHLAASTTLLREDEDLLESMAVKLFNENGLHIPTLLNTHPALRKRVIRKSLSLINGLKNISSIHIAQIESLLSAQSGKETSLPGGICARREYDHLMFVPKFPKVSGAFCFDIPIDTPVFIPTIGYYVQATVENYCTNSQKNSIEICTKYFNYDKISGTLYLRTRLPGDRIGISGVGRKKLKTELSDHKIPLARRDTVPLLAVGNDILWIMYEGGRVSSDYLPKPGCKVLTVEVLDI